MSSLIRVDVEGFERMFATDGIAEQHDRKVNEVVMAKPTPGEAHPLFNGCKHALAF